MRNKKYWGLCLALLCVCMSLLGCEKVPARSLLPTLAPTAAPDPAATCSLTAECEPSEGGSAVLSRDAVRYEDTAELKVTCREGWRVDSVKINGRDLFFRDGVGRISGLTKDATVKIRFTEKEACAAEELTPGSVTATFYNRDATEIGISWHTAKRGDPVIRYVKAADTDRAAPDFGKGSTVSGYAYYTAKNYANFGALQELEADTEYLYSVGDAEQNVFSEVYSFRTKAADPEKLTFLHFSDTQDEANGGTIWAQGLRDGFSRYPQTAFVLNTGDIVQEGGKEALWNKVLDLTGEFLHRSLLVYAAGNHDYWDSYLYGASKCAYSHFCIDTPNFQNVAEGMYYSFDCGDAHFTILNTGDSQETGDWGLTEDQIRWAKKDLLSTDRTWKIVAMHNPMYSPGKYGSGKDYSLMALTLRKQLNPVFSECGVDLVLTGHDHVYSETYPVTAEGEPILKTKTTEENGISYLVDPQGPVHLASGTGGNQARGIFDPLPEKEGRMFRQTRETVSEHCTYSAITVQDDRLTVEYYDVNAGGEGSERLYAWGILKK